MNHGLVNKFFYSGKVSSDIDMYEVYPELLRLRLYFKELNKRDRYYVAMKYHAVKIAKTIYPKIVLDQLAEIVNVSNHATIIYYMDTYIPLEGHGKFIKENFDHFVDHFIYPITTVLGRERNAYGVYKQITLEECRKYDKKSSGKEKKIKKRKKTIYHIKRDPKERY